MSFNGGALCDGEIGRSARAPGESDAIPCGRRGAQARLLRFEEVARKLVVRGRVVPESGRMARYGLVRRGCSDAWQCQPPRQVSLLLPHGSLTFLLRGQPAERQGYPINPLQLGVSPLVVMSDHVRFLGRSTKHHNGFSSVRVHLGNWASMPLNPNAVASYRVLFVWGDSPWSRFLHLYVLVLLSKAP